MKKGLCIYIIFFSSLLAGEDPLKMTLETPPYWKKGYFTSLLESDISASPLCFNTEPFKFELADYSQNIVSELECNEAEQSDKSNLEGSQVQELGADKLCQCLKDQLPKLSSIDIEKMRAAAVNDEMQLYHANSLGVQTAFAREALFEYEAYINSSEQEQAINQQHKLRNFEHDQFFVHHKLCSDTAILKEGAAENLGFCSTFPKDKFSKLQRYYQMGQVKANGANHIAAEAARRSLLKPDSAMVKAQLQNREKLVAILSNLSPRDLKSKALSSDVKSDLEKLIPQLKSISFRYLSQNLKKDESGKVHAFIDVDVSSFVNDFLSFKNAWKENSIGTDLTNVDFIRGALADIEEVSIHKAAGHCSYIAQNVAMICASADKKNEIDFSSFYTPSVKTKFQKGSILLDPCNQLRKHIAGLEDVKKGNGPDWTEAKKVELANLKLSILACDAANDRSMFKGMSEVALANLTTTLDGDRELANKMALSFGCYKFDPEKYADLLTKEAEKKTPDTPSDIQSSSEAVVEPVKNQIVDSNSVSDTESNVKVGLQESKEKKDAELKNAVTASSKNNFADAKKYYQDSAGVTNLPPSKSDGTESSNPFDFNDIFSAHNLKREKAEVMGTNNNLVQWGGSSFNATTGDLVSSTTPDLTGSQLDSKSEIDTDSLVSKSSPSAPLQKEELDLINSQPSQVYAANSSAIEEAAQNKAPAAAASIQAEVKGIEEEKKAINFNLTKKVNAKTLTEAKEAEEKILAAEKRLKEREERLAKQISELAKENAVLRERLRNKGFVDSQDQRIAASREEARRSNSGFNFQNTSASRQQRSPSFNSGTGRQIASLGGETVDFESASTSRVSSGDFLQAASEGKVTLKGEISFDFTNPDSAKVQASKEELQRLGLTPEDQKLIDDFTTEKETAKGTVYEIDTAEGKKSVLVFIPETRADMGYFRENLDMPRIININRASYAELSTIIAPLKRTPASSSSKALGEKF